MSSALLRQALDFVDPDESSDKRKKRSGVRPQSSSGQEAVKDKNKKSKNTNLKKKEGTKHRGDRATQEVISKLLKLSEHTLDKNITKKIVKRAATGKPVADKIKVKTDEQKSILFPDKDF